MGYENSKSIYESGRNRDLVKSLGANKVVDYTREDFSQSGEPAEVYRYVDSGRKRGAVVIRVEVTDDTNGY